MIRKRSVKYTCALACALLVTSTASAQATGNPPAGLQGAQMMAQDRSGSDSWTYTNPAANFSKYRAVIIDPGSVYLGPDAQFDGIDEADRLEYARIITNELMSKIGASFPVVAGPAPNTLRVHVDLIGVQKTVGGLATATRVTPLGFGFSALESLRGKQGSFTGSVTVAVEVYDSQSNELLLAAVRRRTPDPLDIAATLSTKDTVKAVARDFAISAAARLQNMVGP